MAFTEPSTGGGMGAGGAVGSQVPGKGLRIAEQTVGKVERSGGERHLLIAETERVATRRIFVIADRDVAQCEIIDRLRVTEPARVTPSSRTELITVAFATSPKTSVKGVLDRVTVSGENGAESCPRAPTS